jgi:CRISPR/Cas system-associated exonuclease Cas4 (RecB family)
VPLEYKVEGSSLRMTIKIERNPEFTNILLNNLLQKHNERVREGNDVHVSDILPTTCIRRQYYSRKFPDMAPLNHESVHHFVRGEASEFVITKLAGLGVSQAELNMDGIIAHPDIMGDDLVVELKDTVNGKRLNFSDTTFRSYLRQLLYYLTITGIEKGIISIRYNIKELRWLRRDAEGNDYFVRPANARDVGIESWQVTLPKYDIARELLKNEMARRKNLFVKALEENEPSILPRLPEHMRNYKCKWCAFYNKCMNEDGETESAKEMANERDLLDINGIVSIEQSGS